MNNRKAFTIVELIMVVIIIALLLGILLPAVSTIRTKAKETAQKAQFATIDMALEAFKQDYGDYPPSGMLEETNPPGRFRARILGLRKSQRRAGQLDQIRLVYVRKVHERIPDSNQC